MLNFCRAAVLLYNYHSASSGGLSEISVDSQSRSPILRSVELVSCPGEGARSTSYALPDYPQEMFGGQAVWHRGEMMVCGGANWSTTYDQCYSWNIRSVIRPVYASQYQSILVNISQNWNSEYQSIPVNFNIGQYWSI